MKFARYILLSICLLACDTTYLAISSHKRNTSSVMVEQDLLGEWQICSIDSVDWLHIVLDYPNILADEEATQPHLTGVVTFRKDHTLSAYVGCNHLGGSYIFNHGLLTIGDCYATKMYCEPLDGYEQSLFTFLQGNLQLEPYTADSLALRGDNRYLVLRR